MNPSAIAEAIEYPHSDGAPLGETDWHITSMFALLGGLREHFARRNDVYVASNMFLYYAEGEPRKNRAPDIMVIFGVPKHTRNIFKTWEEGAVPSVIVELSSPQTVREDLGPKRELYARLGVSEYYLFDPLGEILNPPFLGFRLHDGAYQLLLTDADGGLTSPLLGLRMIPEGTMIRLVDPATGRPILTNEEKFDALAEEQERADAERERADAERERADAERERAKLLADEVIRLRALLGHHPSAEPSDGGGGPPVSETS